MVSRPRRFAIAGVIVAVGSLTGCSWYPTRPTPTRPDTRVYTVSGTTYLITCAGTPAAPGECGAPVATAGQVIVDGQLFDTEPDGRFTVLLGPRRPQVQIQAGFPFPAGRILECPVTTASGSADPTCYSFPAPATTTTRPPVSHQTLITVTAALIMCSGTPEARGTCGSPVPTQAQLRIRYHDDLVSTDANGRYSFHMSAAGPAPTVQAVLATPPGRILDCPIYQTSTFGLAHDLNAYCYSFPAP
jgi:hypothetical protein